MIKYSGLGRRNKITKMKNRPRNYYRDKQAIINNGYGYWEGKFYRFDFDKGCLENKDFNKVHPKTMFFNRNIEISKSGVDVRILEIKQQLQNILENIDSMMEKESKEIKLLELQYYRLQTIKRLNESF